MVGSFNLDQWSEHRNLEVKAAVLDPRLARELEERFEAAMPGCREVTPELLERRGAWSKFLDWAAFQVMRM
jgi:phosphatidylserine/phosphatidylglycerophosphate/cardiolipin synthase-like enzyme